MPDLTDADRQAMRERCEAATPGPWHRRDTNIGVDQYHASTEIVGNRTLSPSGFPMGSCPVAKLAAGFVWFEGDCQFIEKARTDLPLCLDALDAIADAVPQDWMPGEPVVERVRGFVERNGIE